LGPHFNVDKNNDGPLVGVAKGRVLGVSGRGQWGSLGSEGSRKGRECGQHVWQPASREPTTTLTITG